MKSKDLLKMTVFCDVAPCSLVEVILIALTMEAASTSKTSTRLRRSNPEDSHLHTRRRENMKSHRKIWCLQKM
jgi:hypothetical protein